MDRLDVEIIDQAEDEEWCKREKRLIFRESEFIANCTRHEAEQLHEWKQSNNRLGDNFVWI